MRKFLFFGIILVTSLMSHADITRDQAIRNLKAMQMWIYPESLDRYYSGPALLARLQTVNEMNERQIRINQRIHSIPIQSNHLDFERLGFMFRQFGPKAPYRHLHIIGFPPSQYGEDPWIREHLVVNHGFRSHDNFGEIGWDFYVNMWEGSKEDIQTVVGIMSERMSPRQVFIQLGIGYDPVKGSKDDGVRGATAIASFLAANPVLRYELRRNMIHIMVYDSQTGKVFGTLEEYLQSPEWQALNAELTSSRMVAKTARFQSRLNAKRPTANTKKTWGQAYGRKFVAEAIANYYPAAHGSPIHDLLAEAVKLGFESEAISCRFLLK